MYIKNATAETALEHQFKVESVTLNIAQTINS